jgi:hypothetical protein
MLLLQEAAVAKRRPSISAANTIYNCHFIADLTRIFDYPCVFVIVDFTVSVAARLKFGGALGVLCFFVAT